MSIKNSSSALDFLSGITLGEWTQLQERMRVISEALDSLNNLKAAGGVRIAKFAGLNDDGTTAHGVGDTMTATLMDLKVRESHTFTKPKKVSVAIFMKRIQGIIRYVTKTRRGARVVKRTFVYSYVNGRGIVVTRSK